MEDLARRLRLDVDLFDREEKILKMTASGMSAKEIGLDLGISIHTVNNIIACIKKKSRAQKNTELCIFWVCRKYKVSVTTLLSCAILLMSLRPATYDMRRCRVRYRVETTRTIRNRTE